MSTPPTEHASAAPMPSATSRRRERLVEFGPLAFVVVSLWIKLTLYSVGLRDDGWGVETPLGQWLGRHPNLAIGTLASALLATAWTPLLPRGGRLAALVVVDAYVTLLVVCSAMYLRYYGELPSASGLTLAHQFDDIQDEIIGLVRWSDWFSAATLLATAIVFAVVAWRTWGMPQLPWRRRLRVGGGMLAVALLLALPGALLLRNNDQGALAFANSQKDVCAHIGLLAYHVCDLAAQAASEPPVDDADVERVRALIAEVRRARATTSALFGAAQGCNLILMDAESLQSFPLGLEVDGQPVTPNLTAFARECLNFVNFHDQTHLGTTIDAEFSALQSLHPPGVGYVTRYFSNHFRAAPNILADRGYTTLSMVAADEYFWQMNELHPRFGIQRSYCEPDYDVVERIGPWLSDAEFFRQSAPLLATQPEPFAVALQTASNHGPFDLPAKFRELQLGDWDKTRLGGYLQSVRYFDTAFGIWIDALRREGLLDRSLFVMYGDHHGFLDSREVAMLLEHPPQSEFHRWTVRKHIPLLIRLPHGAHAGKRTVCGGHLDVGPTVLSLLGVSIDDEVMLGRDLTEGKDALVVFRDGSFADGKHYLINRFGPIDNCICYDAATGDRVDPRTVADQRRRAAELLEASDLILRGDLIPRLAPHYRAGPPRVEVLAKTMPAQETAEAAPSGESPTAAAPNTVVQVRFREPAASEVRIVWGLDDFRRKPPTLPPDTFLTYSDSHMNTTMRDEDGVFVIEFELDVQDQTRLDFAFTLTKSRAGKTADLWRGGPSSSGYYTLLLNPATGPEFSRVFVADAP
jgi:phosphoglycerol transferase MdoB-like AlkP superfamily enzyme